MKQENKQPLNARTYLSKPEVPEGIPVGTTPGFQFARVERQNMLLEIFPVPALMHPAVRHVERAQSIITGVERPIAVLWHAAN
jgi:hypothetical protein